MRIFFKMHLISGYEFQYQIVFHSTQCASSLISEEATAESKALQKSED